MQIRRKPRLSDRSEHAAQSLYSAQLGRADPDQYRVTPAGAPDVGVLVRPGMAARTSYGTGGIVVAVDGPYVHVAADGRAFPHFTIVYVPADRFGRHGDGDRNWINEFVAVHNRILKLFVTNHDEVFIGE